MSKAQFQLWIGISVIAATLVTALIKPSAQRKAPVSVTSVTGVLSGLMNGAFAIPGPPVVVYAMAVISEPAAARAFLMAFFFASNILAFFMFSVAGMVTATPLVLLLLAIPLGVLGDQLGSGFFHRFGGAAYRPIALVVALVLGGRNTYAGLS